VSTGHQRPDRTLRAAFTLVLLGPLVAELALGSTPLHLAFLLLLWLPIYGAGVLLIREAVVRTGGGWPSIMLLGVAYEVVEDGIGLQALSSPRLYHAAATASRGARDSCAGRSREGDPHHDGRGVSVRRPHAGGRCVRPHIVDVCDLSRASATPRPVRAQGARQTSARRRRQPGFYLAIHSSPGAVR